MRHGADVLDQADAADDRGRWDRAAVGVVVERDVPRDDRNPERLGRLRHPLDRLLELPRDLRLLRVAEVETVGEPDRLAADTGDIAGRVQHGERAGTKRVALTDRRPVQRNRQAAVGRPEPEESGVQPGSPDRARTDELVVAFVDPEPATDVRLQRRRPGRGLLRERWHPVARTLLGQQARRDLADDLTVVERAQLAAVRDLTDHGPGQLPLATDPGDLVDPIGDANHPLLALGDHDLPGLEVVLAERHAVELDVDARAVARHLGKR